MVKNCLTAIVGTVTASTILIYSATETLAQNITLDGTLGKKETLTGPNYQIHHSLGKTVNNNLFHSFGKFNLNTNEAAIFGSNNNIQNIFSRVTGGNPSSIDGLIRTLGKDVNLFFINPRGIIFGKNARLDISGSFVASTADSFIFNNGVEFSATNPQDIPLLKVSVTPGLQYGKNHPSRTIKSSGNLAVGQDLRLFAGNLDLQGQLFAGRNLSLEANTIKVRDSVTNPFIAAAGNKLSILGRENVDILALNHRDSGLFAAGDMVLSSTNPVNGDIHFWSGGNFQIEKLDGSKGNLFSFYDPIIRSQGDVNFSTYQGASLHILAGGKVDIGTVIITNPDTTGASINPVTTPDLANVTLSDGTSLVIDGSKRPTLDIRAGVNPEVIGNPLGTLGNSGTFFDASINPVSSPNNNPVATSADITIGDVFMAASNGTVLLTNQYKPNLSLPGGDITIDRDGLFGIGINTRGSNGNGGNVFLDARTKIVLNKTIDTSAFSESGIYFGNGGNVNLIAEDNITINPGVDIFSRGLLGGNIKLKSQANIFVIGTNTTGLILNSNRSNQADVIGGNIDIISDNLSVTNGGNIATVTLGEANAGNVNINVSKGASFDGISGVSTLVGQDANGNGGTVNIKAESLSVTNGAQLLASTFGKGNAGNINIDVQKNVFFDGKNKVISTSVESGAQANGGNINIKTSSLRATNGAQLVAVTQGIGNAGDVNIEAFENISFDNRSSIFTTVEKGAEGTGGNITITTGSLLFTKGSQLAASTRGKGKAGNISIDAREKVIFDGLINIEGVGFFPSGAFSSVESDAIMDGGDININTDSLLLINHARLRADTNGKGDAGNVTINARKTFFLDEEGAIFSSVQPRASGNAGNIKITTNKLDVTNGSQLLTTTLGKGNAGDIIIEVKDRVFFGGRSRNGLPAVANSTVQPGAIGNGGNIQIKTNALSVMNGGNLFAETFSKGKAGNILLFANNLEVFDEAKISSATSSDFNAGNIILNIKDNITLSGVDTGIFANTTENSTGKAGNIIIDPQTVTIKDGAAIAVNSQGTGIGGNIDLAAGLLSLDNGSISAKTRSNTGGNINLNLNNLLLLRNGSQISTTAGNDQFGGDGGNININTPFIVAFPQENSDITANAFTGKGGRVDITATGIFGIVPRQNLTELSDITASSEFGISGEVTINQPDVDPSRGLVELPENLVDASQQIAQGCSPQGRQNTSRFVSTGRGGLPLSPNEPLRGSAVITTNWVTLPENANQHTRKNRPETTTKLNPQRIVEAKGWVINSRGEVELVAQVPVVNSNTSFGQSHCNVSSK